MATQCKQMICKEFHYLLCYILHPFVSLNKVLFFSRSGKEWHDLRSKTQKHLMKPRAVQAYMSPMQDVARDFISLLRVKKDSKNEIEGFLENLYKWALECKQVFYDICH